jgi:hypothetical protein
MFFCEVEPFSLSGWNDRYKIVKLSGYGFIYSSVIGCFVWFIPSEYIQPLILKGKSLNKLISLLLIQILITCLLNWVYMFYAFDNFVIKNYSFMHNVKHTASYSSFSFLFYFLHLIYRINPYPFLFRRQNKKHIIWIDKWKFIVEDILYIKSDGNYVTVYYLAESKLEMKKDLRCSLTECEDKLSAYPEFERIHDSYIANFKFVESYWSHVNSLKLKIKMIKDTIPVGRTFQKQIKPLLKNIPRE